MTQTNEAKSMAHAYTPGLKIKKIETVRKERVLPIEGEVLVKVGDRVDFHTTLAHTEIPGDAEILNVNEILDIDPGAVFDYMLKKEGEQFKEGELLAKYTAFWGLVKNFVYAPFDGKVESISGLTGQVIVRQNNISLEVDSYIRGKIVGLIPSKGAVVETQAAFIQGIFGFGGENHGAIAVAVSSPSELLDDDKIKAEHKGKVIIGGSGVTSAAYKKAIEVGVKGIVVGGMNVEDLIGILGEDIGVAITGEEDVKTTVIATEGFGALPMSDRTFKLFKEVEGRMSAINGATQIRAGVLRPEIIVPYDEGESFALSDERFSDGMAQGSLVRIIRAPHFGEIAKVAGLPVNLQTVQSGSKVRVIEVELEDGRVVTVPRANVEIIEE